MKKSPLLLGIVLSCALMSCSSQKQISKEDFAKEIEGLQDVIYSSAHAKGGYNSVEKKADWNTFKEEADTSRDGDKSKVTLKLIEEKYDNSADENYTHDDSKGWQPEDETKKALEDLVGKGMEYYFTDSVPELEAMLKKDNISGYIKYYKSPYKISIKLTGVNEETPGIKESGTETYNMTFDKYGYLTSMDLKLTYKFQLIDANAYLEYKGYADYDIPFDISVMNKVSETMTQKVTISYK